MENLYPHQRPEPHHGMSITCDDVLAGMASILTFCHHTETTLWHWPTIINAMLEKIPGNP